MAREDTLRNPAFTDSSTGGLATFDCVIANPPFSLKEWGRDLWEADPWGRAQYGIPPESYGDYAFVQHMISSMAPTGNSRMAVRLVEKNVSPTNVEDPRFLSRLRTIMERRRVPKSIIDSLFASGEAAPEQGELLQR